MIVVCSSIRFDSIRFTLYVCTLCMYDWLASYLRKQTITTRIFSIPFEKLVRETSILSISVTSFFGSRCSRSNAWMSLAFWEPFHYPLFDWNREEKGRRGDIDLYLPISTSSYWSYSRSYSHARQFSFLLARLHFIPTLGCCRLFSYNF